MKVAVVIPNWNGQDYIANCLKSLEEQTLKPDIIVVDNGSVDNSVEIIQKEFPGVKLLPQKTNLGFTGGVNKGIRYAIKNGYEYVALFNNDAIASISWLKNLVESGNKHQQVGIVTGKLMRADKKRFDSTGDFYSIRGIPFPRGRNQIDKGQYNKIESVFGASGGASLYRVKMFEEVGLFDERFFAYYEDVDISFRARLRGWDIIYNPSSIAYHEVSATSSKLGLFSYYHSTKNFYFLYLKNMPSCLFLKYLPSFVYQAMRSAASSLVHFRTISYLRAMLCVLFYAPSVLKSRYSIQKNRRISCEEIDKLLYHSKPPISPEI